MIARIEPPVRRQGRGHDRPCQRMPHAARRRFLAALLALFLGPGPGCGRRSPPYEGKDLKALQAMVDGSDPSARVQGAFGLGRLGQDARPAVPSLLKALKAEDPLVRQAAARALGQVRPDATEAVPALMACLQDPEWSVRRQAAQSLGEFGREASTASAALDGLLRDKDPLVRQAARQALGRVRP